MPRDNIVRQRRKLKSLSGKVDAGEIPYKDVENMYGSWRGNAQWYNANETIRRMDSLYNYLFVDDYLTGEINAR